MDENKVKDDIAQVEVDLRQLERDLAEGGQPLAGASLTTSQTVTLDDQGRMPATVGESASSAIEIPESGPAATDVDPTRTVDIVAEPLPAPATGDGVSLTAADHPEGAAIDEAAEPAEASIETVELDSASLDPDGQPATGGTPQAQSDVTFTATGGELSDSHVTPLPDNGPLGPIEMDTAVAAAGEIIQPQRAEWQERQQPPSMGRIVHYRAANSGEMPDGNEFHAAMITKVNEDWTISLSVFPEGRNPMFASNVAFDPDGEDAENVAPGTWCWPPRV